MWHVTSSLYYIFFITHVTIVVFVVVAVFEIKQKKIVVVDIQLL